MDEAPIIDFLYNDARRIGSFLSQFDPHGYLKAVQKGEKSVSTESASVEGRAGINIPLLGTIGGAAGMGGSEAQSDDLSKTYDPLWRNALTFFEIIQKNKMANKDVGAAGIGEFIIIEGALHIQDTAFIQKFYQNESVRSHVFKKEMMNPETGEVFTREELDVEFDAMAQFPAHVQVHFLNDKQDVLWGTLIPEGLVTSTSEITLKYGPSVEGIWTMIGIKDAEKMPDPSGILVKESKIEELIDLYKNQDFMKEATQMGYRMQRWIGRHMYFYGVTPLAIFRRIGR